MLAYQLRYSTHMVGLHTKERVTRTAPFDAICGHLMDYVTMCILHREHSINLAKFT